jgi:hypothetical protein
VGVKTPIFRPTMMITGSTSAQAACLIAERTSASDLRAGDAIVSLRASHHHVNHSVAASISAGKMPAKNSLEIETLAATPKMTKPMLGGTTGAMIPAEAIRPAERPLS